MARKQRHTGAFFTGSLFGGMLGAALTLWKTPRSGSELRDSLGGGSSNTATETTTVVTSTGEQRFSNPVLGFIERATAPIVGVKLGKLARDDPHAASAVSSRTSAADARPPGTGPAEFVPREPEHGTATAIRDIPDTAPTGVEPVADEPGRVEAGTANERTTSQAAGWAAGTPSEPVTDGTVDTPAAPGRDAKGDREPAGVTAVNPDEEATHHPEAGSEAPAATAEDLTTPPPEYVDRLEEGRRKEQAAPGEVEVDFPDSPRRDTTN
jgi:hypothetical protein